MINYLVCTEIDEGYSPEEVALSLQELHDRGAGEVERTGGTETAGIIGAVHQTFVQTVPSHFKIVLAGARRTITVKAPPALKNANVNVTTQNKLSIELDPAELDFQPGSTVTPWASYHEFHVTFDIPIPPESMERFYFRYRIVNAVSDSAKQKLRAEMLFLPSGKTLLGLPPDVMNMVREPAIPAVMVAVVEQPILWFGGDTAAQSNQFTTLISQVFVSNPWERQEFMMPDQGYPPAEEAFKKPVLSSVLHARLLYEITKLFAQCPAESIAGTPLKNFWNDVDKNRAKVIETEPNLRLAARPCKEEEQNLPFNAGLLWAKSLRRFAQARRYSKNAAISDEIVENLDNFATAPPRDRGSGALQHRPSFTESPPRSQNKQLAHNGPSCSVRKRKFPRGQPPPFSKSATEVAVTGFPARYKPSTAPLPQLKRMPDLEFMAGDTDDEEVERENFTPKEFVISCLTGGEISAGVKVPAKERLHTELVPMYFAPDDTVDPESQRGKKPLFKLPLQLHTRSHAAIPPPPHIIENLKASVPRATEQDVKNIHADMSLSLSRHSLSSVKSVTKAYTKVFGNEQWLHDPLPTDREILLSRLIRCGTLKKKSALQYMKLYGTVLGMNGKKIHPPSATYLRMVSGINKGLINPIQDVATKHRRAHSLPSLRIASAAFAKMREDGLWSAHQALTAHAILMTCFWGRFRCGEVLPTTNNNICILDSILKADVVFVREDDGSEFIRIWIRKEKNTSTLGGNIVEIPKLPKRMADICPFRALKAYIHSAEKLGLTRFDPLFTLPTGFVVTTMKFAKWVSQSVKRYLPPGSTLFDEIKNHSCRAGVLTALATYDVHLDEDVAMFLGRWHSSAYKVYQKNFEAALRARRVIEKDLMSKLATGDRYVNNKKIKFADQS